ncbi:acyl-CoA dehydrogenase [Burkholderia stagnalis]|nr:acyl-CoA dehydrogenase [Burkholderia stagnalis]RQQ24194.1 acyl-CoA dehydrogenase [Burkholderia stagnalis]RQQ42629.1 acyl-CoA dehydrogenase [Burkholderia stagnalis]RQX89193.1 acyl-CoA dehydrogenase [Burkholderia stagnalis]RQY05923.1 acyl-CoA dehydrogenase [Burkholderia stagnalis]
MHSLNDASDASAFGDAILRKLDDSAPLLRQRAPLQTATPEFAWEKWFAISNAKVFRSVLPAALGGCSANQSSLMRSVERIGYLSVDAGLNFSVATQLASSLIPIHTWGTSEAKARYLDGLASGELIGAHAISEETAGSDVFAMQTTAVDDGDDVVINGEKTFVTNGPLADLIVVYAKRPSASRLSSLSAFVVETGTPGVQRGSALAKVGLHGSLNGTLTLRDCRVPKANLIGGDGGGFHILDKVMKKEILLCFVISIGESLRRLEETIEFAKTRRQFGARIASNQAIAHKIADMRIGYETARALLYQAAAKLDSKQDATIEVAAAKIVASDYAIDNAIAALHVRGGAGYLQDAGAGEAIADTLAGPIYSGTNEIQRNRIAVALGL